MSYAFQSAKLVVSGRRLELYLFNRDVYGDSRGAKKKARSSLPKIPRSEEDRRLYRQANLWRTRRLVSRLINANAGQWIDPNARRAYKPLFWTLTFKENLRDVGVANAHFTRFIKRFNWDVYGTKRQQLKYVAVMEFQKRGAVHYHLIVFNLPFTENLHERIWSAWRRAPDQDFVFAKTIYSIDNVGAYVVKYMTKQVRDSRLDGKKLWFRSRGLRVPKIVTDEWEIADILSFLSSPLPLVEKDFDIPFVGEGVYKLYTM